MYKGMFLVGQLRTFFADLQNKDYESAIAMVHSRFSTNTNPSWERAHPKPGCVHNGEINRLPSGGNADKMLAREENMESLSERRTSLEGTSGGEPETVLIPYILTTRTNFLL